MKMTETHYDIIREVSNEGWDFKQNFIRALIHAKAEKKEKSALAYAFGAEVEETGKHFCPDCDQYLTEPACNDFEQVVRGTLRREIRPYLERHCPTCESKLEDMKFIREVVSEPAFASSPSDLPEHKVEAAEKIKYEPCGCLHENGEEKIRWDLEKGRVEQEANVFGYDGPVFNYGNS